MAAGASSGASAGVAGYRRRRSPEGWRGESLRLIVRRVLHTSAELSRDLRARRLRTTHPDQLQLALADELGSVYGYSFILTDRAGSAQEVERFHRSRAQIEERFKEAKLGQALRHLPSGDGNADRLWLQAALTALNLAAMLCDVSPALRAAGRPGSQLAEEGSPEPSAASPQRRLRRAGKTLRWLLFCVPARIVRSRGRTILRLPDGLRNAHVFVGAYAAAHGLPPP